MSDFVKELDSFFMHFIHVEDATYRLKDYEARQRLKGKRWGWLVNDDASALHGGWKPAFDVEYMGIKNSEKEAVDAAVGYVWAARQDIVDACKRELALSRQYRRQREEGKSGMAVG